MTKRINLSKLTEGYYDLSTLEKAEIMERVKKAIKRKNSELLNSMTTVVEKHLTHYKQDFYIHDIELIHQHDVSFLWLVRDSGTHWINLENHYMVSEKISFNEDVFEIYARQERIIAFYYYNKVTKMFTKINEQKARTLIKQQYEKMTA